MFIVAEMCVEDGKLEINDVLHGCVSKEDALVFASSVAFEELTNVCVFKLVPVQAVQVSKERYDFNRIKSLMGL